MRLTCCLILCGFHYAVFSQDRNSPGYVEVKGVLIDSLTSQPIPSAHIRTRNFTITSNPDGTFYLLTLPSDSIHISHISYQAVVIPLHSLKPRTTLRIAMIEKVTQLNAVVVYRLSEESFKKEILETTPTVSSEDQNAKTNIAALNYYIKSLPQLPMNGYENYREQIKGPQAVTIFSSGGQKGLIKAIRNVIKFKPVPYKSFSNQNRSTSEIKWNSLRDSSAQTKMPMTDSLEVKD